MELILDTSFVIASEREERGEKGPAHHFSWRLIWMHDSRYLYGARRTCLRAFGFTASHMEQLIRPFAVIGWSENVLAVWGNLS